MKKFKEKKIVNICNIIIMVTMILFLLSLLLVIFSPKFLLGIVLLPCILPFAIMSFLLSDKDKYTREFLKYMRNKLDNVKNLEDLLIIKKEFEELAIENKTLQLSFPVNLKELYKEICNKIEILEMINRTNK